MKREITTKEAVETLIKALKEDGSYYMSWKANIAMAFIDEIESVPEVFKNDLHNNANNAADRFLKQLLC